MTTTTTSQPTPPVDTVQQGVIRAAIWANTHKDRVRYSVTLERRYTDEQGNWKSTQTLGRDDLLRAGRVLELAETKIFELEARDRDAAERDEPVAAAKASSRKDRSSR